ncbi:MAG TPA: Hsp20/alpha crystallin family protein [Bacillota bacterium]|nr:Hsp20/alpha crystallin family protein [Bacillota bacterium]HOA15699.1 Hsp20/alpha crystallin family protein [Bacillota bacterium]HOG52327.1 Hsp20/alpha crystallin family protein [Bacillota bacterium]
MNIVRWNPYREVNEMIRTMNRVFEEDPIFRGYNREKDCWTPAVDIEEDEKQVVLKAEMPGFAPEEIDINLKENMLEIKAETKVEEEKSGKNFIRRERRCGSFYRAFEISDELEVANAKANYKNGLLELVIPKKAKETAPEFKIKVNQE